jgi:hypothetical protein
MDRADIKLGFTLAYLAACALHLALAWAIQRRHYRALEVRIFAGANLALAAWQLLQLAEFLQHARVVAFPVAVNHLLAGGQLVLGLLVLVLFFHLFATFERVYRRQAPSLRAALTTHVHRHRSFYVPTAYVLLSVGALVYLVDAGGMAQIVTWARGWAGPASAYLLGGTLLLMTFVLFPARAGQERIPVPALGRGLLMASLLLTMGLVALWHQSHPVRTVLAVLPYLHLHTVAFCVFLALVRYEFSFMDHYIQASLRLAVWGAVVLACYFAFNRVPHLLGGYGRVPVSTARVTILLVALVAGSVLGRRVTRWSDRVLFDRETDLTQAVHRLAERLARCRTLRELIDGAAADITAAVHAKKVHLVVGTSDPTRQAMRRELDRSTVPYRHRLALGPPVRPIGWMLLGERRNLYPYFDGERRYLHLVAELLGGAVEAIRSAERPEAQRATTATSVGETVDAPPPEASEEIAVLRSELARARRAERELRERFDPELLGEVLEIADELAERNPVMALNTLRRLHAAYEYVLASEDDLTTLAREMRFAQDYLALEKLRLRNRLEVQLSYDARLKHQAVPRRLLQPLIENALRHGVGRELRSGCITIRCVEDGMACELTIEDNGGGFPTRFTLDQLDDNGGLARVRRRLNARYGEAASIEVDTEVPEGARLHVRFPRHDLGRSRQQAAQA